MLWARNMAGIKCQDVAEAETRACLLGRLCVHDTNASSVILESDNAYVVEAIRKKNQGLSRLWNLFGEINDIQERCVATSRLQKLEERATKQLMS